MKNLKVVYTSKVADILISMGEVLSHVRSDLKDPSRNVFVFEDSPTFHENLQKAIKQ